MSKEQTPIEKLIQFCWDNSIDEILKTPLKQKLNELLKEEQQYAQYREKKAVLEALERVREKLTEKTFTDGFVTSNAFKVVDEEIAKQK